MAFARVLAVRGALAAARASRPVAVRPQLWRQVARRGYASGHGHESAKSGGDLPWAIGAVAVTVPSCWFLMQSPPEEAHESHDGDHAKAHDDSDDHDAEADEADTKESTEEEANAKSAESEDKSDESSDDDKGQDIETPATSDDESDQNKKSFPDAKGGIKKRTESPKGKKQGEAYSDPEANAPKDKSEDKPAASKEPGDMTTQSGKQEGLSNTDTKHSTDVTDNPEKSTKGEGSPETAKVKGSVDPERPAK